MLLVKRFILASLLAVSFLYRATEAAAQTDALPSVDWNSVTGETWARLAAGQQWIALRDSKDQWDHVDAIRTETGAGITLSLGGGQNLNLLEQTTVIFDPPPPGSSANSPSIMLQQGRLAVAVTGTRPQPVFLMTPTAQVRVDGGRAVIEVIYSETSRFFNETRLFVLKGSAALQDLSGQSRQTVSALQSGVSFYDGVLVIQRDLSPDAFKDRWQNLISRAPAAISGNPQWQIESAALRPVTAAPVPSFNSPELPFAADPLFADRLENLNLLTDRRGPPADSSGDLLRQAVQNRIRLLGLSDEVSRIHRELAETALTRQTLGDRAAELAGGIPAQNDFEFAAVNSLMHLGIVSEERFDSLAQIRGILNRSEAALADLEFSRNETARLYRQSLETPSTSPLLDQAERELAKGVQTQSAFLSDAAGLSQATERLEILRDAERAEILDVVNSLYGDRVFRQQQAEEERLRDTQQGKVLVDAHGYRARQETYFLRPDNYTVEVAMMTLRTAGPHEGMSVLLWGAVFAQEIHERRIRDLAWSDILRGVPSAEMGRALGSTEALPEYEGTQSRYIVYESRPNTPESPDYPAYLYAQFFSPIQNNDYHFIQIAEFYSDPFQVDFEDASLWVQARYSDDLIVCPNCASSGVGTFYSLNRIEWGGQSGRVRDILDQGDATADLNYYGFFTEQDRPAYFLDEAVTYEGDAVTYLLGIAIPFDNQGRILETDGFKIRGLGDWIRPDPAFNDGRYNLEMIIQIGSRDPMASDPSFTPSLTFDALIPSEIFAENGFTNSSNLFDN